MITCMRIPYRIHLPMGSLKKDWWQRFLKQWPCITKRKPQYFTTKRAATRVPDIINACSASYRMCSGVQDLMRPILVLQSDYMNCDETAFLTSKQDPCM